MKGRQPCCASPRFWQDQHLLQNSARSGASSWVAVCARASDRPESGGHFVSGGCALLMDPEVCKKMDLVESWVFDHRDCSHGRIELEEWNVTSRYILRGKLTLASTSQDKMTAVAQLHKSVSIIWLLTRPSTIWLSVASPHCIMRDRSGRLRMMQSIVSVKLRRKQNQ